MTQRQFLTYALAGIIGGLAWELARQVFKLQPCGCSGK